MTMIGCWLLGALTVIGTVSTGRLVDPTGKLATVPIDVPGDVHSALLDAGVIPDPYFGTNECLTTWVGDHDWIIEWDFDLSPEQLAKKRLALRFEDVDTLCDLSLNGRPLGSTANRFRRFEFEIAGKARAGRNTLRGFFRNVVAAKEAEAQKYGRGYWVHGPVMQNLNLIRKPFCHGGWDWGPRVMNVGFMKRPVLIATDGITVDYVHCDTDFSADYTRATVEVTVEYTRADGTKGTKRERKTIERPQLWWPHGMGPQAFTEVTVDVEGTSVTKRLGLRKLELVTEKDALGSSFYFRVNGRKFFAKGADFIPCDALESRQTPARYANLLQSALDANMNMVRVWGGGQYERDFFYDWCDEHGLLVWQDCMLACACYPGAKGFLEEIDREVRHQIRRLKDHPSIALWCGDRDFETYRDEVPRFCSEFGYQSLPSPEVARKFCGQGPINPDGPLFTYHQKDAKCNRRIREMVGRYFAVPSDPEELLWISQVQQGLAIKTAIECWRSSQPRCMGTLFWQLNDNWPVASWSSIEYGGKWKVVQHLAKRFYAPTAVVAIPVGDDLEIRGISDVGARSGTLTVTTYDFDGAVVARERSSVTIPEGAAVLVRKPLADWGDVETRRDRFLILSFDGAGTSCENDFLFARPKDCKMRPAHVRQENGALVTDKPAFFVIADGARPHEGNCFTLLPGRCVRTSAPLAYWYNRRKAD